jgi:uncharacterized membrane protein
MSSSILSFVIEFEMHPKLWQQFQEEFSIMDKSTLPFTAERMDLEHITRSEFVNAMVHLYRGELGEATAWRSRIDTTTNWAVVLSATALSFVFSDYSSQRHVLIPIVSLFCTFFMLIEARRYRFFDIWRSRARMIEINFYRPMLEGSKAPMPDWAETLAHDMEWPHFHLPLLEAVGRRLRRNYQWIYAIQFGSWILVLMSHPTTSTSLSEVVTRASIGPLSGWIVITGMLVFYSLLLILGIYSYWVSHNKKNLPAGHPGRLDMIHRH